MSKARWHALNRREQAGPNPQQPYLEENAMQRALIAVITGLAVVVLCWPQPGAAQPDKSKVKKIMQEKLKQS